MGNGNKENTSEILEMGKVSLYINTVIPVDKLENLRWNQIK